MTDDGLWRALAENTNLLSKLLDQQRKPDSGPGAPYYDACRSKHGCLGVILKCDREFRASTDTHAGGRANASAAMERISAEGLRTK
jgi:hypothetical protein